MVDSADGTTDPENEPPKLPTIEMSPLEPRTDEDDKHTMGPLEAASIEATSPPLACRTIDRDEPVDNFSEEDIADLQRAADYFSVFCYTHEAFELYTLVLKSRMSDEDYRKSPSSSFWYLVTQCVHNANKIEHCEIILSILLSELH